MAACCGRSSSGDGGEEEQEAREFNVPDNDLSLQRVHNIIDRMSQQEDPQVTKSKQQSKIEKDFPEDH